MTYQLMGAIPILDTSEQARDLLIKCDWNLQAAIRMHKEEQTYVINFVLLGGLAPPNNAPTEMMQSDFNRDDEALTMIGYLSMLRPLEVGKT
jgi:UBA-like domain